MQIQLFFLAPSIRKKLYAIKIFIFSYLITTVYVKYQSKSIQSHPGLPVRQYSGLFWLTKCPYCTQTVIVTKILENLSLLKIGRYTEVRKLKKLLQKIFLKTILRNNRGSPSIGGLTSWYNNISVYCSQLIIIPCACQPA